MRGRVSAVNQIFIISSNEMGKVESGVTAALFGPVVSVVGGGLGTLLVVAGIARYFPELRRLGSLKDVRPADEATAVAATVAMDARPLAAASR
jgi:hypothetical protein